VLPSDPTSASSVEPILRAEDRRAALIGTDMRDDKLGRVHRSPAFFMFIADGRINGLDDESFGKEIFR